MPAIEDLIDEFVLSLCQRYDLPDPGLFDQEGFERRIRQIATRPTDTIPLALITSGDARHTVAESVARLRARGLMESNSLAPTVRQDR